MANKPLEFDLKEVERLASLGLSQEQLAAALGVSEDTVSRRKVQFAEFADAIKKGRAQAKINAVQQFYQGQNFDALRNNDINTANQIITRLLAFRQTLSESELLFEPYISQIIKDIRNCASLTIDQKEQLVLIAVEKKQATHSAEIAEDTKLPQIVVKKIVRNLVERNILKLVTRYVPNSPRKHSIIKSNRIKEVEAI